MFGLMQARRQCSTAAKTSSACSSSCDSAYTRHRLHYCGTCKAIGREYGHKARFSLNVDAVFLSEMLTALSGEQLGEWSAAMQAMNRCFTMPSKDETLPPALHYAAAANVLLAQLKINDNIVDSARLRYRFARWFMSSAFRRAEKQWQAWGVDTASFWAQAQAQDAIEKGEFRSDLGSVSAVLDYYAAPTMAMTGEIYAQSARIVLQDEAQAPVLRSIGEQMGRLMYVLDAFEDVEEDLYKRQFNPLALYFGAARTLETAQYEEVRSLLLSMVDGLEAQIKALPLESDIAEAFGQRLQSNIAMRLYRERYLPTSWRERIAQRWTLARERATEWVCSGAGWTRSMRYHLVSIIFFILPQAVYQVPQEMRGQTLTYWALFAAALAALGIGRTISQLPVEKRRRFNLWQRWKAWRADRKNRRQNPCITACAQGCCECCCSEGSRICCQACCDDGGCCDCASWDKKGWRTFLWVMLIIIVLIAIAAAVVFLVI